MDSNNAFPIFFLWALVSMAIYYGWPLFKEWKRMSAEAEARNVDLEWRNQNLPRWLNIRRPVNGGSLIVTGLTDGYTDDTGHQGEVLLADLPAERFEPGMQISGQSITYDKRAIEAKALDRDEALKSLKKLASDIAKLVPAKQVDAQAKTIVQTHSVEVGERLWDEMLQACDQGKSLTLKLVRGQRTSMTNEGLVQLIRWYPNLDDFSKDVAARDASALFELWCQRATPEERALGTERARELFELLCESWTSDMLRDDQRPAEQITVLLSALAQKDPQAAWADIQSIARMPREDRAYWMQRMLSAHALQKTPEHELLWAVRPMTNEEATKLFEEMSGKLERNPSLMRDPLWSAALSQTLLYLKGKPLTKVTQLLSDHMTKACHQQVSELLPLVDPGSSTARSIRSVLANAPVNHSTGGISLVEDPALGGLSAVAQAEQGAVTFALGDEKKSELSKEAPVSQKGV